MSRSRRKRKGAVASERALQPDRWPSKRIERTARTEAAHDERASVATDTEAEAEAEVEAEVESP